MSYLMVNLSYQVGYFIGSYRILYYGYFSSSNSYEPIS